MSDLEIAAASVPYVYRAVGQAVIDDTYVLKSLVTPKPLPLKLSLLLL